MVEELGPKKTDKPQPAEDVGPAPGYNLIETPDGGLAAEVPPSWGVQTGENSEKEGTGTGTWSYYAGEYLPTSITTAPSLDVWYGPVPQSGAYFVASKALTQFSDYEITNLLLNEKKANTCAVPTMTITARPTRETADLVSLRRGGRDHLHARRLPRGARVRGSAVREGLRRSRPRGRAAPDRHPRRRLRERHGLIAGHKYRLIEEPTSGLEALTRSSPDAGQNEVGLKSPHNGARAGCGGAG